MDTVFQFASDHPFWAFVIVCFLLLFLILVRVYREFLKDEEAKEREKVDNQKAHQEASDIAECLQELLLYASQNDSGLKGYLRDEKSVSNLEEAHRSILTHDLARLIYQIGIPHDKIRRRDIEVFRFFWVMMGSTDIAFATASSLRVAIKMTGEDGKGGLWVLEGLESIKDPDVTAVASIYLNLAKNLSDNPPCRGRDVAFVKILDELRGYIERVEI